MLACTLLFLNNNDDDCPFLTCNESHSMMSLMMKMMSCLSGISGWLIIARPLSTGAGCKWVMCFLSTYIGQPLAVGVHKLFIPFFSDHLNHPFPPCNK